jgi:hypothetical protein
MGLAGADAVFDLTLQACRTVTGLDASLAEALYKAIGALTQAGSEREDHADSDHTRKLHERSSERCPRAVAGRTVRCEEKHAHHAKRLNERLHPMA